MPHAPADPTTNDHCRLFWDVHVPRLLERGRDTTIPGLTAIVRFEIAGPGGGTWTVTAERGRIERVECEGPEAATALVALDAGDFAAIARGSLDHREAFFAGRIRVEGDIGLVLWAANLIPLLRETFPFEPEKLREES